MTRELDAIALDGDVTECAGLQQKIKILRQFLGANFLVWFWFNLRRTHYTVLGSLYSTWLWPDCCVSFPSIVISQSTVSLSSGVICTGWFSARITLNKGMSVDKREDPGLLVGNEFSCEKSEHWSADLSVRFFNWFLFAEDFFTSPWYHTEFYLAGESGCEGSKM